MTSLRNIKGTKDLLPHDTIHWREVENIIHHFMAVHGYGEIRTPVFEPTKLFLRGIGEGTDIVSKEMYSWTDQGGGDLTLRPETYHCSCSTCIYSASNGYKAPLKSIILY